MAREHDGLPVERYRNKERDRKVEKRKKETEPTRFYHVTGKKYNYGDVLIAKKDEGTMIFMSDEPLPHTTIAAERVRPATWFRQARIEAGDWKKKWDKDWYVYEVEPIGPIEYGIEEKEIGAKKVKVLRFVGNARALLANQERKSKAKGKTDDTMAYGSMVHGVENVKEGKNKVRGHGRMYWEMMRQKHKLKKDRD
ncbi:hypothetical protein A3A84_03065 [Candidatus Collierbacteria bacterium RIFCSPLOWO2_01_FULL_50_23]|uniref:Uncharacterized protein n=2 Tax=Candidatus Collieribacteriota TaxID=1752725 RepID=A0A1F5EXJ6_9BACT|nr:MAG: hypothetical protein A2703_03940 [Candidatus Collierbacteria bacterium RIFCSPHIGHO2_01_FULL_50_25]OGD71854.1 MAG: hypothetical protein A3D09_01590 [Candidatus Collierbacteria bacterium RIFCSPHIGHO2_02_FULL_49_10]OGD74439.1 MAG: hypothetical protein A3A84_03065 [Candidatus Collierbacteria bacterium RIFCSPLOWO2_01_FULL_50_23]